MISLQKILIHEELPTVVCEPPGVIRWPQDVGDVGVERATWGTLLGDQVELLEVQDRGRQVGVPLTHYLVHLDLQVNVVLLLQVYNEVNACDDHK